MSDKAKLPPTPKDSQIRQAMGLGIGIWDYFEKNQKELGDVFTLKLPGQGPMVWTADLDMIKDIIKLTEDKYDQSLVQLPVDFGEHNTVFLNEKEHLNARKMIIPSFNTGRLKARAGVMHEIITEYIERMNPGDVYNLPRLIGDITLDIICYTMFDLKGGERRDKYRQLMGAWLLEATSDTLFTIGSAVGAARFRRYLNKQYLKRTAKNQFGNGKKGLLPWKRAVDLKVQLAHMIREDVRAIRERMDEDETHVLSILARATDEDGNLLDEERVLSEAIGLFIAGHETSAATASWLGIWMQQNPQIEAKVRDEVIASINAEGKFDALKVSELPYVTACLNESQRLTPSAPGFIRWLRHDTQLGDWLIPGGTAVLPNIYLTQRKKEVFGEDATQYRPERWLEGKKFAPHEFFPFGGGRRACVGMNQARQQLRIIFAEFARRVEFTSEYQGGNENTLPRSRLIGGQTEPQHGVMLTVKSIRPYNFGFPEVANPEVANIETEEQLAS
ncbi:MAG: cytochrome P450 [Pseudomonadales bacterium]|nr:cytochrome P450 [Pseudomonadales bacterium]